MANDISKKDLFNVIKHGHNWHAEKIRDELKSQLENGRNPFNHHLSYDTNDKYHYIYDNECYLFIFDGKVEVRCDRDNVNSSHKTITYKIKEEGDIVLAYEMFNSMTMEDEED